MYHVCVQLYVCIHNSVNDIIIPRVPGDSGSYDGSYPGLRDWTIENKFKRLVTLSPLTPMATHFHIKNGAKQVHINEETQNFEYELQQK